MQTNAGRVFILRAIDSTTASIAQEVRFEISNWTALCALLDKQLSEFDPRAVFDLDPEDVAVLVAHFDLDFDARSKAVELHPWHPNDDLPYQVADRRVPPAVEDGREIRLERRLRAYGRQPPGV